MTGGKNTKPLGYTILEVMIVLAVSGVMFVIAANFINGKQERAAFNEGVNQTAAVIQGVINDVQNGKYSDVPIDCSIAPSGSLQVTSGGTPKQGSNPQCVFLGKLIRFSYTSSREQSYKIIPLAGKRLDAIAKNQQLSQETPKRISALSTTSQLPQGLRFFSLTGPGILFSASPRGGFDSFGIVLNQGNTAGSGGFTNSSQSMQLVYSKTVSVSPSTQGADNYIDQYGLSTTTSVSVCVTDGTRYAEISVGGSGSNSNPLAVNVRTINKAGATNCS